MKRVAGMIPNLDESLIDGCWKGIPSDCRPFRLGEIGKQGWNILRQDTGFPVAVLKQSALAHNSQWMRRFLQASGALLAPHGKTTMAPRLFHQQIADGAWGITLATIQQVRVARQFGVQRILLANQLVDPAAIRYIVNELASDSTFRFLCLIDSIAGVERLALAAKQRGLVRPLELLLEGGLAGGRAGCRTVEAALDVARAVKQAEPHLTLRGVEGFEGIIADATPQQSQARVREFLSFLVEIACCCEQEQLFPQGDLYLSAGGTEFFDLVADILPRGGLKRAAQVLIRSGCYLTHDSDLCIELHQRLVERTPAARELGEPPRAALELWSCVLSRPEESRAICSLGKRDASFDARLPLPIAWFRPGLHPSPQAIAGAVTYKLNDQHLWLDIPPTAPLGVGDLVAFGISHPCTTFDKWRLLLLVDDDYNVMGGVETFF